VEEIILFHVVTSGKESIEAETKLESLLTGYKNKSKARLSKLIQAGNIFDHIGKAASETNAALIVMGTHGIKGMQHIIGSRAMKVITNSETPYIVVQQKDYRPIKKILVPVDFTRESKQLLPVLETVSIKFKADLFLILQKSKDEFIEKRISNNLQYIKSSLREKNITFAEAGFFTPSSLYKDVLQQAKNLDADLIVTTIDRETNIADYIMGVEEQKIVANEAEVPVLCIHISHFATKMGSVFV
jgi:nucleotide-binding universal stress UspA family protein